MPNGTYGGVRGEKFIKNYPLLDYQHNNKTVGQYDNMTI